MRHSNIIKRGDKLRITWIGSGANNTAIRIGRGAVIGAGSQLPKM
jgi:hypothetical protein